MIFQTLKVAIAAALLVCVSNVSIGQDCGCGAYAGDAYGYNVGQDNCGRAITHEDAMGLWDGYCNESCGYQGGCGGGCGTKLCGRLRGKRQGSGGCGGGCDNGCFGYPAGGGCEVASRCGGKLRGVRGSCKLKGLQSSGCGGKLKGLFSGSGCGCKLFNRSRGECGSCGAYFNEAVGYEYGNAGIQSCVSGVSDLIPTTPGMNQPCCGQPMASQPIYGAPIVAPAAESSSVDTAATTQIEGDVVETQDANAVEAAVEAAEVVE